MQMSLGEAVPLGPLEFKLNSILSNFSSSVPLQWHTVTINVLHSTETLLARNPSSNVGRGTSTAMS